MKNNVSAENYLETILVLGKQKPYVRAVDICEELRFRKSSVSVAMKRLREKQQILVSPEGYITLTDAGREIAETIYSRHQLIETSLLQLGVDKQIAHQDACRIEHYLSPESYAAIKQHLDEAGIKIE